MPVYMVHVTWLDHESGQVSGEPPCARANCARAMMKLAQLLGKAPPAAIGMITRIPTDGWVNRDATPELIAFVRLEPETGVLEFDHIDDDDPELDGA